MTFKKIQVVGNAATGKTWLSRNLAEKHSLPVIHIDSIQFQPGLRLRPFQETEKILNEKMSEGRWIIDGMGPLGTLQERFFAADRIVFIDLPLSQIYGWAVKRQFENLFRQRSELPEDCSEVNWAHAKKLFSTIHKIHHQMRPELLKMLTDPFLAQKVIMVPSTDSLKKLALMGLG